MGCFELKGRIEAYPRLLVLMVPEYMALSPGIYLELISASEAASLNHELCLIILNKNATAAIPHPLDSAFSYMLPQPTFIHP